MRIKAASLLLLTVAAQAEICGQDDFKDIKAIVAAGKNTPIDQLPCLDEQSVRDVPLENWAAVSKELRSLNGTLNEAQLENMRRQLLNDMKTRDPHCRKPTVGLRDLFVSDTGEHGFEGRKFRVRAEDKDTKDTGVSDLSSGIMSSGVPYGPLFSSAGRAFAWMQGRTSVPEGGSDREQIRQIYDLAHKPGGDGFTQILNDKELLRKLVSLDPGTPRDTKIKTDPTFFNDQYAALIGEKQKKSEYLSEEYAGNGRFAEVSKQFEARRMVCPTYDQMKLEFDPKNTYFKVKPTPITVVEDYIDIEVPFGGNVAYLTADDIQNMKSALESNPKYQDLKESKDSITSISVLSSTAPLVPHPKSMPANAIGPSKPETLVEGMNNLDFSAARAETMSKALRMKDGLLEHIGLNSNQISALYGDNAKVKLNYDGTNLGQDGLPNGTSGAICPYIKDESKSFGYRERPLTEEYLAEQRKATVRIFYKRKHPIYRSNSETQLTVGVNCKIAVVGCAK